MRKALLNYLDKVEANNTNGNFNLSQTVNIKKATRELEAELNDLLRENSVYAIDLAKKEKAADFAPYLAQVQRLLCTQGMTVQAAKELTSLSKLVPVFGGGLDNQILNGVWHKVWPDALSVDDRIRRLSSKTMDFTERTVKQGVSEGKSAANIMKELRQHFEVEGLERKAAFRLAAHTTNMCYEAAQAEISLGANFVMGIRITRAVDGSETCDICAEHAGEVGGPGKEYFKDDFGGRSYDLYVMTNAPGYHPFCKCEVEDILEDAVTLAKRAIEEYGR